MNKILINMRCCQWQRWTDLHWFSSALFGLFKKSIKKMLSKRCFKLLAALSFIQKYEVRRWCMTWMRLLKFDCSFLEMRLLDCWAVPYANTSHTWQMSIHRKCYTFVSKGMDSSCWIVIRFNCWIFHVLSPLDTSFGVSTWILCV